MFGASKQFSTGHDQFRGDQSNGNVKSQMRDFQWCEIEPELDVWGNRLAIGRKFHDLTTSDNACLHFRVYLAIIIIIPGDYFSWRTIGLQLRSLQPLRFDDDGQA